MKDIIIKQNGNKYEKHKDSVEFALYFRDNSCGGKPTKIHISRSEKVLCGGYLWLAVHNESDNPSRSYIGKENVFEMVMSDALAHTEPFCKKCLSKITIISNE